MTDLPLGPPDPLDMAALQALPKHGAMEAERLLSLVTELARRRMEALRLYEALPTQERFHASRAPQRVVRGGNRAGKSLCTFVETARAATGTDPYGKYPTNRPLLIYIIGYDEDHIGRVVHRMLFRAGAFQIIRDDHSGHWRAYRPWDPEDKRRSEEAKPAPPLIPPRLIDPDGWAWEKKTERVFSVCRLRNGTEIRAFGSKSEPAQGDPVDLVHIDEDLHLERWVAEMQARLSDRLGRLIWGAFPHAKNDALTRMSLRADEEKDRPKPYVEEFILRYSDNPHIDEEAKRQRIADWTPEERRARDYGEFLTDSVLMFPTFHIDRHGIPRRDLPDKLDLALSSDLAIPPHWTRYMVIDPGHTTCAVLFLAVPTPDVGDYVVLYDELYIRRCDAETFAQQVAQKAAGQQFEAFIIDDHGSRVTQAGSGVTIRRQYSEALEKYGVRSNMTGSGFVPGSDDVAGRCMKVREWLTIRGDGTTKFRLVPETTRQTQAEFLRYKKRIVNGEVQEEPVASRKVHGMDCFDEQTEVLTRRGWRRFAELAGDELATVNLANNKIEYQRPDRLIDREHSGEMFVFGGGKLDAVVTPDHRMVVYPRGHDGDAPAEIKTAQNVSRYDRLKLHATWEGNQCLDPILVPHAFASRREFEKEIDAGDLAEFLGWYVAEGSADSVPKCPGHGYRVVVAQTKPLTKAILGALLTTLPWNFHSYEDGFYASSKQLWEYVRPLGNKYEKRVPQWVKDASPDIIRRFLIGAMLGDGHEQNGRRVYYTVSRQLADDIQELFIKIGGSASILIKPATTYRIRNKSGHSRQQYWVSEWTERFGGLRDNTNTPNFGPRAYEGRVYCATVPSGTLIVRRNGRPLIAGNCLGYAAAFNPEYVPQRPMEQVASPALSEFRRWQEAQRQQSGQYVNLGPGSSAA